MPTGRIPTSKLPILLRPSHLHLPPIRSILQPATILTPSAIRVRLNCSASDKWRGTKSEDHVVNRSKRRDTTDPTTAASAAGMAEREESEGIADATKSQGTTERGGVKQGRKAKEEHPKAPEPIIGMNDERAQKGH